MTSRGEKDHEANVFLLAIIDSATDLPAIYNLATKDSATSDLAIINLAIINLTPI